MPRVKQAASYDTLSFAREQRHQPTRGEKLLWSALRNGQVGVKFRRQHPFDRFVLDFYCDAARLAVEVDGPLHDEQVDYDRWRDERLAELGLRVLRVRSEEVEWDVVLVVDRIRAELAEILG